MRRSNGSWARKSAVVGAQVMVLIASILGSAFLRNETGGTLFLFAVFAPLLLVIAVVILAISLSARYRARLSRTWGERRWYGDGGVAVEESGDQLDPLECGVGREEAS